ncbi:MAG: efflux RND transporter periplasmic adaptor subunit [Bacteroidota bacterium]
MKKIITLVIVLAVVVIAARQLSNNREINISQKDNISIDIVSVTTADVLKKSSSFTLEFTGTLYPMNDVDIVAETQGKITSLNFTLGQYVQEGDLLTVIDDRLKQLNYESAKINAEKLKKDYHRAINLFKDEVSSEQELDKARTDYESAKIAFDEAEKQLSYTRITSPIEGIITSKSIDKGDYVNTGSAVASVINTSKLKVKLNVSESDAYYLSQRDGLPKAGNRVIISTDIYSGIKYDGGITFVGSASDVAHNFPVEIEMQNSSKHPLKAGTFVKVKVNISSEKLGLFIPRKALIGSIKDAQVYVVKGGKVKLTDILIGGKSIGELEVLSGLKEGDKVIVSGQVNLTDNKSIKIINN